MTRCIVFFIRLYSLCLSPFIPPSCRFQPTCSEYAVQAAERFGVVRGGWLTCKRLLRCHPWGGHGYDPLETKCSISADE